MLTITIHAPDDPEKRRAAFAALARDLRAALMLSTPLRKGQ